MIDIDNRKALHEEWKKNNLSALDIVNISQLPIVMFDRHRELPKSQGLYFVYVNNTLVYLGVSKNIKQRFCSHHLMSEFKARGCTHIAYYEHGIQSAFSRSLDGLEGELILTLRPELNYNL